MESPKDRNEILKVVLNWKLGINKWTLRFGS